ncbi:hypothetical protein CEXT_754801, partial [Caerostris extrusa]
NSMDLYSSAEELIPYPGVLCQRGVA